MPPAGPLLVFAVRGRRAAERAGQIGTEANVVWFGSTRPGSRAVTSCNSQPLPSGSLERGVRVVGAALGIRAADRRRAEQIRLVRAGAHVARVVEHFADRDATSEQLLRAASMSETTRYRPWAEPGAAAVTPLPKITEAPEPGGVNWRMRKSSPSMNSASMPPAELAVEWLGAIDIRNRDDGDFELHVDGPIRVSGLRHLRTCDSHVYFLRFGG